MSSTKEVSTALPDLREVRLDELAALTPAALDKVVQRVLPGSSGAPVLGAAFGSSI
jgi:FXSXX-COOH protein